jgi:hypothetical protein
MGTRCTGSHQLAEEHPIALGRRKAFGGLPARKI